MTKYTEPQHDQSQMNSRSARSGKIARLPHAIREQLNRRLQDNEPANGILDWLNELPEVKETLRLHFEGRPIAPCNLTEWKNGGYHDWCLRQDALGMVESLADQHGLGDHDLAHGFNDKIAQWTSIHLASAARALLANETDPKNKLTLLHQISADINRLRRGDLHAERLDIDRRWLELETEKARQKTDDEFWAWTKRPDIAKKLNPDKPKGITTRRLREIEDVLCLNESNFDQQIMGRLMRQRRLTHEAAAMLLAEKAAELDAAERVNKAKATPGPDGAIEDPDDDLNPIEARFAELCAEHGVVLDPEPPPPTSPAAACLGEAPPHQPPNSAPADKSQPDSTASLANPFGAQQSNDSTTEAHPEMSPADLLEPKIENPFPAFTNPETLRTIGPPRLSLFLSRFASDLAATGLQPPPAPDPDFPPPNGEYFDAVATLLRSSDLPQPLRTTLSAIEHAAAPQQDAALDAIIQRRLPCISLNRACPVDCALEVFFACPEELDGFRLQPEQSAMAPKTIPASRGGFEQF